MTLFIEEEEEEERYVGAVRDLKGARLRGWYHPIKLKKVNEVKRKDHASTIL